MKDKKAKKRIKPSNDIFSLARNEKVQPLHSPDGGNATVFTGLHLPPTGDAGVRLLKLKKESFQDYLSSKILLIEIGLFFSAIPIYVWYKNFEKTPLWGHCILSVMFIAGMSFWAIALFAKKYTTIKIAEKTGNHEALIVFTALSVGISSLLLKLFPSLKKEA